MTKKYYIKPGISSLEINEETVLLAGSLTIKGSLTTETGTDGERFQSKGHFSWGTGEGNSFDPWSTWDE